MLSSGKAVKRSRSRSRSYHAYTDRENISCLEKDKLIGGWFTIPEMREVRHNGHMESWSTICFDELLDKEGEE